MLAHSLSTLNLSYTPVEDIEGRVQALLHFSLFSKLIKNFYFPGLLHLSSLSLLQLAGCRLSSSSLPSLSSHLPHLRALTRYLLSLLSSISFSSSSLSSLSSSSLSVLPSPYHIPEPSSISMFHPPSLSTSSSTNRISASHPLPILTGWTSDTTPSYSEARGRKTT